MEQVVVYEDCSFRNILQSECHLQIHTRKTGLRRLNDFKPEEKEVMLLRCSPLTVDDKTAVICIHHEKLLLSKYQVYQTSCCDPFQVHKKHIKKGIREVSHHTAKLFNRDGSRYLKPGQKLCTSCRKKVNKHIRSKSITQVSEDVSDTSIEADVLVPMNEDISVCKEQINKAITTLGCSPIKLHGVGTKGKLSYGKRKLSQVKDTLTSKLANVLDFPSTSFADSHDESRQACTDCKDLTILMQEIKQKCASSTKQEQLKLLTLAPTNWTIEKTAAEFSVSKYMVNKARKLKKENGILAEPAKYLGKHLPEQTVLNVVSFFEDDEFSRMCPGKKEYISVKTPDSGKIQKQKRLLLVNLKQLYVEFKTRHPSLKIGFSKFCSLRPKWCITVESKGIHSVCVCECHQNLILMASALPEKKDYKYLLENIVCSVTSRNCMLHSCSNCPGQEHLQNILEEMFQKNDFDTDDNMNYKQWIHDDHVKITDITSTVGEFIEKICRSTDQLRVHHYTAKSQSSYLRTLKDRLLPDTEAVILLDFAENYSFVCQDAIQGFHWETVQATLHPFVVYFRQSWPDKAKLHSVSFCILSDSLDHTAVTVHCFLKCIVDHLVAIIPQLKKVYYFSDGASSQYKNCKNFMNLCYHEADFNIAAEWNFFATSHGKSPCDGIGGTIKRLATRASLQATVTNHIFTPTDLYKWAKDNIVGITIFYKSSEDIQTHAEKFGKRLENAKTVPGTRSHHKFVPVSATELNMYLLSSDEEGYTAKVAGETEILVNTDSLKPGKYVAAVYDNNWYIGCIISCEETDILVKFMVKKGASELSTFSWPQTEDKCHIPFHHVLCEVPVPTTYGSSGRQYRFDSLVLRLVGKKFTTFIKLSKK